MCSGIFRIPGFAKSFSISDQTSRQKRVIPVHLWVSQSLFHEDKYNGSLRTTERAQRLREFLLGVRS